MLTGASLMLTLSKAIPSKLLQVVPAPKAKRNLTLGCPASSERQCLACTHVWLPNPPWQLPLVCFMFPVHPSWGLAKPLNPSIDKVLYQFWLMQLTASVLEPTFFQVLPAFKEYCNTIPSLVCSDSQKIRKARKGCCRFVKSKQGLVT